MPFDVYTKPLNGFFLGHEMTADRRKEPGPRRSRLLPGHAMSRFQIRRSSLSSVEEVRIN
jgi:hypothetical protein